MSLRHIILLDQESEDILQICKENPYFNFSALVRETLKKLSLPLPLTLVSE